MSVIFNLFVSLLHFLLTYAIFIIVLISNDTKILFIMLIIMFIIKYFYYFFGRCILTLYEYNNYFPTIAEVFSSTLTNKLPDKKSEEVIINIGVLMILNKLLVLLIYNYYKHK
jgi:hypothetical protein